MKVRIDYTTREVVVLEEGTVFQHSHNIDYIQVALDQYTPGLVYKMNFTDASGTKNLSRYMEFIGQVDDLYYFKIPLNSTNTAYSGNLSMSVSIYTQETEGEITTTIKIWNSETFYQHIDESEEDETIDIDSEETTIIDEIYAAIALKQNSSLKGYYKSSELSLTGSKTTAEYIAAVYTALTTVVLLEGFANVINDSVTISDVPTGVDKVQLTIATTDESADSIMVGYITGHSSVSNAQLYYGFYNGYGSTGFTGWHRYLNNDDLTNINDNLATKANLNGGNAFVGDQTVSGTLNASGIVAVNVSISSQLNKNNTKIVNLGNGTNEGDAVNKSQLDLKADKTYVDTQDDALDTRVTTNEGDIDNLEDGTTVIPTYELKANKGATNGYAPLVSGKVPSTYIPNSYDNYEEVATYADLPAEGRESTVYVVIADETSGDNTSTYRWTGSVYGKISDTLSASEVKTLYESNENTNAYTDAEKTKLGALYTKAQLDTLLGDRYTKAEVDALLDELKAVYGWESTLLTETPLTNLEQLYTADLQSYDLVLFEVYDINSSKVDTKFLTKPQIFDGTKVDFFGDDTVYVWVRSTVTTFYEAANYSLIVTGIKMDGTVHNEMRSVGSETITYREDGKISSVVADTITTTPTYDEYGNITKITEVYALDGKTYETTFTYDKFGRISATNKVEV